MNANIGFGRRIGPADIRKVQHNEVQILFHSLSELGKSANITVEAEPIALVAFGLLAGEKITVNNVFRSLQTPMFYNGEALELTATNNVVMLAFAGVYNCTTTITLGNVTLIAYAAATLDKNIDKVVGAANPNGPQAGTYYDGSAGVTFSQEFYIGSVPLVFRAYGLTTQTIELQALFKDKSEPVWEENSVVALSRIKSTMVVHIAGRYRFKLNGDSTGVILTNNHTDINFDALYFKRGEPGVSVTGAQGVSAYQAAVSGGYTGTEAAWIASLTGPRGPVGAPGLPTARRVQVITSSVGGVACDWAAYDEIRVTLTANTTFSFSGPVDSQGCILRVKQGGAGGWIVTLPASVRYNAMITNYAGTLTGGKTDIIGFVYDGTDIKYDFVSIVPGI